ncbi:class I SAM-dependent methyltransferase [Chiayiivirga flava]|uniref:SAM-dependent methyltransferase n=1 Tax=Chiayiivirga flava TaxID=659595 RepID=A0A7W8D9B2_9GAMM|nr:class I SAM-dependent methyltransferase [Chiayiivirga flava]MBB5209162.1 SAM-dependent methyltransferase [Chiayiivirga flava]
MNRCPICGAAVLADTCAACGFRPASIDGFVAFAPDLARAAPGYDPEHYRSLAELEAGNFWFRARNALILDALARYFPAAQSYLEIGCGTGYVLSAVAAERPTMAVHGSEIFVEGLAFAAQRTPRATLFQMDARRLPFDAAFDVIGAFDVIEHIDEEREVLQELFRAVRPGGGVVLTVPQHPWLWSVQDDIAHHVRRYRRGEPESRLAEAGFKVVFSTSFVALLLPALMLSRLGGDRAREAPHDPFREFRIPRWLDSTLALMMRFERVLIHAGLRFPVGGSRLVVATKALA